MKQYIFILFFIFFNVSYSLATNPCKEVFTRMRKGVQKYLSKESPVVDLRGVNLAGKDLRGTNLRKVDLRGANLEGVNLAGANLKGVNFLMANLEGANLKGVDFQGANLEGVDLRNANLQKAFLHEVNFLWADLRGANFERTILSRTFLKNALYDSKTKFPKGFDPKARGMILFK